MMEYYGICLVILVIGFTLCVCSKIIFETIYGTIVKEKKAHTEKTLKMIGEVSNSSISLLTSIAEMIKKEKAEKSAE